MAKVYPQIPNCSSNYMTSRRETFTIWMKSLVFHGNGCTVFDSNGGILYRVDNYGKKCSNKVYLMDLMGKVLFSIQKKKLRVFGWWDSYKLSIGSEVNKEGPLIQVRKDFKILKRDVTCRVTMGSAKANVGCYKIVGWADKSDFKIIDYNGELIAEAKQKQSCSGVLLGDDVLTLVVEPQIDHSLIMALVSVYSLINRRM